MEFSMFKKILDKYGDLFNEKNRYIALGGGEPTTHPEFWKFLGYAQSIGIPWLATNGKKTQTALALCRMAKKGLIGCALSLDKWHDDIDGEVIEAFTVGMKEYDYEYYKTMFTEGCKEHDRREVRTAKIPYAAGRAKNLPDSRDICCCHGIQFRINGGIYACGCEDSPMIGTVDDGITHPDYKYYDLFHGCHKERNKMWSAK
jgi:hypothetical protein